MFTEIQYPKSLLDHGEFVAAVSQTELKPQWALLLPGLCLTAKLQIFCPCPVDYYNFIEVMWVSFTIHPQNIV